MLKQLTPILFVTEIGPQLEFWVDRLGFSQIISVAENPDRDISADNPVGFVILQKDDVQVMLQTWTSIANDIGWQEQTAQSFLYVKVDQLDEIEQRLSGYPLQVPKRQTFYGAWEIGVRDPAGNLVIFAQFAEQGGDAA